MDMVTPTPGRGTPGRAAFVLALLVAASVLWLSCDDNPGAPGPVWRYPDDSLVVRVILDANGLHDVPCDSVADTLRGRINALNLSYLDMVLLPNQIGRLDALAELFLHGNLLRELPDSIVLLQNITTLTLGRNRLCELSGGVLQWAVDNASLSDWQTTQECLGLDDDTLAVRVILDANGLTDLPVDSVVGTTNDRVTRLYLAHRALTVLPDTVAALDKLEWLDVHDNLLSDLPGRITSLENLSVVMLEDNQLCSLTIALQFWAESFDPDWQAFQTCSTIVVTEDSLLFVFDSSFSVDTLVEGDGVVLPIRTRQDSVVIDSIVVLGAHDSVPLALQLRPVGLIGYGGADTMVIRSHGSTYGDSDGSPVAAVPRLSTAYLLDFGIQVCLECSTGTPLAVIRDSTVLQASVAFHYRRIWPDSTRSDVQVLPVSGRMQASAIEDLTPTRRWLLEFRWENPATERVDFSALPDTCDSYLEINLDSDADLFFWRDSLNVPAGGRLLGVADTSDDILQCGQLDSVAEMLDTLRYATEQADWQEWVPTVPGGIYWLNTLEGHRVLLYQVADYTGGVERYQFLWAYYQ